MACRPEKVCEIFNSIWTYNEVLLITQPFNNFLLSHINHVITTDSDAKTNFDATEHIFSISRVS